MNAITKERWQQAQDAEIKFQQPSKELAVQHFRSSYGHYFEILDIPADLKEKTIIEIGCADVPAMFFCRNLLGVVIEPLDYPALGEVVKDAGFDWIKQPVEEIEQKLQADEIWLLNVMQHIIDPDAFIEKVKSWAPVIRFFEPINYPTCEYHPHTFTLEDYREYFGDAVRFYQGGSRPGFHTADCVFGVWEDKAWKPSEEQIKDFIDAENKHFVNELEAKKPERSSKKK